MRVHYKEAIHDEDNPLTSEWLPKTQTSGGDRVTDPKGLLFMCKGFAPDLSQPALPERWKHGDVGDAEGLLKKDVWQKRKVMLDILKHRMTKFTPEQKDQWRALNDFHEQYHVSDQVPNLPISLRAGVFHTCVPYFL